MIVDYLNVFWTCRRPAKADSMLVIDPDTVLTSTVALQRLEPIAWRDTQVIEAHGNLQLSDLAQSGALERRELLYAYARREQLCCFVLKRNNHLSIMMHRVNNVKRYY